MQSRVLQLGNPKLRKKSKPVLKKEIHSENIKKILSEMKGILNKVQSIYRWPVFGLSAPQVGILKRITVIDYKGNMNELINPKVIYRSPKTFTRRDGCLSFFFLRGTVIRNYKIIVEALDKNGEKIAIEAEDYFSRVIQHEIDHLNGILYLDRIKRNQLKSLTSVDVCYKDNPKKLEKIYKIIDFVKSPKQ
jgi:peptide deformylase